jgi:hypothetical protein
MKMGFDLQTINDRHARLVRALAVFFLLFTGADIIMPQYFCGQEEIGIPLKQMTSARARRGAPGRDAVTSAHATEHSQPYAPEVPRDDDCFCCCAHVVPGRAPSLVAALLAVFSMDARIDITVPSPPLPTAYRPPRFV